MLSGRVRVYRNLRTGNFSVLQRGKVVAHVDAICLRDVRFVVSEKGRQRVIRDKRKNVHAWVDGTVAPTCREAETPVTYNPYEAGSFVRADDRTPVACSATAAMRIEAGGKARVYAGGTFPCPPRRRR